MNSRIFTNLERQILRAFLNGEPVSGANWNKIRWRLKTFNRLAEDVGLYTRVKAALAESEAT